MPATRFNTLNFPSLHRGDSTMNGHHARSRRLNAWWYLIAFVALFGLSPLAAQTPSSGKSSAPAVSPSGISATGAAPTAPASPAAGAVKLPDGTVVFFTKNPDDPNPPVNGVLLSPEEYKQLVESAEQLKKLKAAPKPQAPSECHIRAAIETRGDRSIVALTATFSFRTTLADTSVELGAQRAFPVSARLDGKLPTLSASEDGLTVLVEKPGAHTVVLTLEAPIVAKGGNGELGFDLGLPRAAISTLVVLPIAKVQQLTIGVRTPADRPNEFRRTIEEATSLNRPADKPGFPLLSPAEQLEVSWETPSAQPQKMQATSEATVDVKVRVDAGQLETQVQLRLKGSAKEWQLMLPANADVSAERSTAAPSDPLTSTVELPFTTLAAPVFTRPTDVKKPLWLFKPTDPAGTDWIVTATFRHARPKSPTVNDPVTYSLGPIGVPSATRVSGSVSVFAPATIALRFEHSPGLRRQDVVSAEKELVAQFKFSATHFPHAKPDFTSLLDLEARTIPGYLRVQPEHSLTWFDGNWRLRSEVRITPVRMSADSVSVEVPNGWEAFAELSELAVSIDEPVREPAANHVYVLRLKEPQSEPFSLILSATYRGAAGPTVTLPMPQFEGARTQNAKVTATVPEGFDLQGTATVHDGHAASGKRDLLPEKSRPGSSAVTKISGQSDMGISEVTLSWSAHRPELHATLYVELTLQHHQLLVDERLLLSGPGGLPSTIRLHGPAGVRGLKSSPALQAQGASEWITSVPNDKRESELVLSYALPLPASLSEPVSVPVGLLWPNSATRIETTVRIWDGGGAYLKSISGPWREMPLEAVNDRKTLPLRVISALGNDLPFSLELVDSPTASFPTTSVERSLHQAWLTSDGNLATRSRFVLTRWPATGLIMKLPEGVTPTIRVNDQIVKPLPVAGAPSLVQVLLPAPTPDQQTQLLDVGCLHGPSATPRGTVEIVPPMLHQAASGSSPRWQILSSPDVYLMTIQRDVVPESHWLWHRGLLQPTATAGTPELEHWLLTGEVWASSGNSIWAGSSDEDTLVLRQPHLNVVRVTRVPRTIWIAACSLLVLVVGLALASLRGKSTGPVLATLGIAFAVFATIWPQPTALAIAGALPGALGLAVLLIVFASIRAIYHRRITYLPGFIRPAAPASNASAPQRPLSTTSQPQPQPPPPGSGASSKRSNRTPLPTTGG